MTGQRAFYLVLVFCSFCGAATAGGNVGYPVPDGAAEVAHVDFAEAGSRQDSFSFQAPFPSEDVLLHYRAILRRDWIECLPADKGWTSYLDVVKGKKRRIHHLVRQWASRANDAVVTLDVRYVSGRANASAPDTDVQRVFLVQHPAGDARAFIATLGGNCARAGG